MKGDEVDLDDPLLLFLASLVVRFLNSSEHLSPDVQGALLRL